MSYQLNCFNTKANKAMTKEQFNEIVDAILDGKYSWACVLILSFAGYNPLHYIPYRTYNRLIKDNCQGGRRDQNRSYSQGKKQDSTRSSKELISQK